MSKNRWRKETVENSATKKSTMKKHSIDECTRGRLWTGSDFNFRLQRKDGGPRIACSALNKQQAVVCGVWSCPAHPGTHLPDLHARLKPGLSSWLWAILLDLFLTPFSLWTPPTYFSQSFRPGLLSSSAQNVTLWKSDIMWIFLLLHL